LDVTAGGAITLKGAGIALGAVFAAECSSLSPVPASKSLAVGLSFLNFALVERVAPPCFPQPQKIAPAMSVDQTQQAHFDRMLCKVTVLNGSITIGRNSASKTYQ
jgi:hypothetical protein